MQVFEMQFQRFISGCFLLIVLLNEQYVNVRCISCISSLGLFYFIFFFFLVFICEEDGKLTTTVSSGE